MVTTKKSLLALFLFLASMFVYAQDIIVVEWAPFIKVNGISDEKLIKAADLVNSNFLVKQEGFISRELVKKNNIEYADIIHWKTKSNAISASEKVNACIPCGEYFSLMDMENGSKAGAGFSHYSIIKKW